MFDNIIQFNKVSIGYKDKLLCESISWEIKKGTLNLLLGANGKGKSTLLKGLMNIHPILNGSKMINNKNIESYSLQELSKTIALLPAKSNVIDGISVYELLSYSRIPYKTLFQNILPEDDFKIKEASEWVGINDLLNKYYSELSDGQKQKVNIARCLVQETPIIILDEPTSHLDIVSKIQIYELLKSLAKKGKTIICTTHDIKDAFPFSDEVGWFKNNNGFINKKSTDTTAEEIIKSLF